MADDDTEKSEEPTERRLNEARNKGQTAKSEDLNAGVLLFFAIIMLWYLGSWMQECLTSSMYRFIHEEIPNTLPPEPQTVDRILLLVLQYVSYTTAPFVLSLFVIAIIVNIYQVGLNISAEPLELDFNKLNPVKGLTNLFGMQKLVKLLMGFGKVVMVLVVAYHFLSGVYGESAVMYSLMPRQIFIYGADLVWTLAFRIAAILFILAVADTIYQKHKFSEDMKMSKQEVKDENRNSEGDPAVKSKRMQKMMELARQRMMQEIPEAEVVVRNPTHYAVALKFKPEMSAPEVVAKGKNNMAMKIIDLAKEANVPVWQEPWLARKLYEFEVGEPIPPELFQAVADILAHVMDKEKQSKFANMSNGAA